MSGDEQDALWRQQYRARRYLEHMTEQELEQRFNDVARNAYVIGRDGNQYLRRNPESWIEWFTLLLEELTLRQRKELTPNLGPYPNAPRAAKLWDSIEKRNRSYLLKPGRREYMRALYEEGRIRVSPAGSYNDPSLNAAIRDNESEFIQESINATVKAPPERNYTIPHDKWETIPIIGTLRVIRTFPSDYYVSCFAAKYEYRLFDDFGYDSCVVIWDAERFMRSLAACTDGPLRGWGCIADHVQYWDPFNSPRIDNILFAKHFRYSYQNEYRIIWEPGTKQTGLTALDFELGPLTDYCDSLAL